MYSWWPDPDKRTKTQKPWPIQNTNKDECVTPYQGTDCRRRPVVFSFFTTRWAPTFESLTTHPHGYFCLALVTVRLSLPFWRACPHRWSRKVPALQIQELTRLVMLEPWHANFWASYPGCTSRRLFILSGMIHIRDKKKLIFLPFSLLYKQLHKMTKGTCCEDYNHDMHI